MAGRKPGPDQKKIDLIISAIQLSSKGLWVREISRVTGLKKSTVSLYLTKHLKDDVEEVPFDEQEARRRMGRPVYKHSMIFNGSSIEIFPYNPTKKEITEKLHIRFGQVFRYINQKEYQEILKMARMQRT